MFIFWFPRLLAELTGWLSQTLHLVVPNKRAVVSVPQIVQALVLNILVIWLVAFVLYRFITAGW